MSEQCPECSFAWSTPILDSFRTIAHLPEDIRALLHERQDVAYDRPEPQVWSMNEYVWHLADTFRFSAEWLHDIRTQDHPTHYAIDTDALTDLRQYNRMPLQTGLWSLAQSCRLFIEEAAVTDPMRTCYYHDWQDVTAEKVVGFLAHEAVHHLFDLQRSIDSRETSHAS